MEMVANGNIEDTDTASIDEEDNNTKTDDDSAQQGLDILLGGLDLRLVKDTDWETLSEPPDDDDDDDAESETKATLRDKSTDAVRIRARNLDNDLATTQELTAEDIASLPQPPNPAESQLWKECMSRVHVLSPGGVLQEPSIRIVDLVSHICYVLISSR